MKHKIFKDSLSRQRLRDMLKLAEKKPCIALDFEVSISAARDKLRQLRKQKGINIGMFSYLLYLYARTIEAYSLSHGILDYRYNVHVFDEVDVFIPVIIYENGRPSLKSAIIRGANRLSMQEISEQVEKARESTVFTPSLAQRLLFSLPYFMRKWVYGFWQAFPAQFKKHLGTAYFSYIYEGIICEEGDTMNGTVQCAHSAGFFSAHKRRRVRKGDVMVVEDSLSLNFYLDHRVADGMFIVQMAHHFIDLLREGKDLERMIQEG